MKIIHRYLAKELMKNLALASVALCLLFLVFDFFDRVDGIIGHEASLFDVFKYFLFKVPFFFNLTLPIAMLVATMLTLGILSKNSEITAMRASGMKVFWLAKPVFTIAILFSFLSIVINETLVPYCTRRVKEIYNIDIKERDKTGAYSQNDFWWRSGDEFYSVAMFDSRSNTLHHLSKFEVDEHFKVLKRLEAKKATWVKPGFGWTMHSVNQFRFREGEDAPEESRLKSLPLLVKKEPKDFYDAKTDPFTMSYLQLKRFIKSQSENGLATEGYLADLQAKIAFPFVIFICTLVVLPFSLKPARTGNMAGSFFAGLIIAFTYYAVHSFSLAMGRAELWPYFLSAWMANILMGFVGIVLTIGAESPE